MKQMNFTADECSTKVLRAAYQSWMNAGALRKNRLRNKDFTYGRQWDDLMKNEHGVAVTEGAYMTSHGCKPITNNMIRQMVKSVVGRFRTRRKTQNIDKKIIQLYSACMLDELDSRALEEFLIAGCVVQRIDIEQGLDECHTRVDNVNLNRFFMNRTDDCRNWDDEIIGQLHDMSIADLMRKVAGGDRARAEAIRQLYSNECTNHTDDFATAIGADSPAGIDFWHARGGKCRAIEVWTLESQEVAVCANSETGKTTVLNWNSEEARAMKGTPATSVRWDIAKVWRCRWFTPMGDLLSQYDSPYSHGKHPFVVKFYPLTDGEVHSLVEDVIGQQKYVNRLITMLDHMMDSSAKGVLLYPIDAMPSGFSWRDIRRVWASADGVLPYSDHNTSAKPEQIIGKPSNLGAYDMISLQMKLFEYVSGVNGSLQGRHETGNNSSRLYESEVANGDIAISDLIETFGSFLQQRDVKMAAVASAGAK